MGRGAGRGEVGEVGGEPENHAREVKGEKVSGGQSAVSNGGEIEEYERKRGATIGYPRKGIGGLGERAESWRHGAF